jgi:hypothetical protein
MKKLEKKVMVTKSTRWEKSLWDKVTEESARLNLTQNTFIKSVLELYFAEKEKQERLEG